MSYDETITLTTAQAIIRWLSNQFIEIDGEEMRLCGGGFGIFGQMVSGQSAYRFCEQHRRGG